MARSFEQIRCQRCRTANPFGEELCTQCGTRLMLVVEPMALRYEEETAANSPHDEYLVERISLLENRLLRLAEKLEKGLDLLLRQSKLTHYEHLLLETLVGALDEAEVLEQKKLYGRWRAACEREDESLGARRRKDEWPEALLEGLDEQRMNCCAPLIFEGCALIEKGDPARGLRLLKRAAAHAGEHAPLNFFVGVQLFRLHKPAQAGDYFERALKADPSDARALLLLGIACGERGDAEDSCRWLGRAAVESKSSFAASYAHGRVLASRGNWERALKEFKTALAARPSAEANYVVGLACYRLGRLRSALRYVKQALELDPTYAPVHFLEGLLRLRMGDEIRASESLARAQGMNVPPKLEATNDFVEKLEKLLERSFLGAPSVRMKRLLLAGDPRLAALLEEAALEFAAAR